MKLTTLFLIGFLACAAMGQVEPDTMNTRLESAIVLAFTHDNFDYGAWWQDEYSTESEKYRAQHSITPTEYQAFLDDSIMRLGFTLTETFEYVNDVGLISGFLYIEAIKHKALMDERHDELYYSGNQPGPYAEFLHQQMAMMDFAIAGACSAFSWTHNPLWDQETQLHYLATLLFDSIESWSLQFTHEAADLQEYLTGIGYEIPVFEQFMRPWVKSFAAEWLVVMSSYKRSN